MTTERALALAGISEKIFSFYSEKGYHYDSIGQSRIDSRLKSVEAVVLAQEVWEGKKSPEDWFKAFGDVMSLV